MWCRGIRGATTVEANTREDILEATKELLLKMLEANDVVVDDLVSIFFTTTTDLTAEFPAVAARELGLTDLALLCGHEMSVQGALGQCIRILMLVNTDKGVKDLVHVYLRGATNLKHQDPR
jgi:chorismate mutase